MSEQAKGYNGYKNYETWCVQLWLSNDQGSDNHWRGEAADCIGEARDHDTVRRGVWTAQEAAKFTLADRLKEQLDEAKPDLGASMWADLLGAALDEVDWHEVAEAWLQDEDDYKALANPPADED
jgi:hypothetical protein